MTLYSHIAVSQLTGWLPLVSLCLVTDVLCTWLTSCPLPFAHIFPAFLRASCKERFQKATQHSAICDYDCSCTILLGK